MSLSALISASIDATLSDDAATGDLSTASAASAATKSVTSVRLTDGTGAGQADLLFADTRVLTASTSEDLDLAGVLTDIFGNTVTAVRIKAILIQAAAANTTDVIVGAGTNAWETLLNDTGTLTLPPGAAFLATAGVADATGWTVTAGTGDILQVEETGGEDVTYNILVIGASA